MGSALAGSKGGEVDWAFFIGPDKSGSSWVQDVFEAHRNVAVPRAKDLFYFDRFYERGPDWYFGHFPCDETTTMCVEVCHDYLFSADAARRIAHDLPSARLMICARHPVDRSISAYLYMRRQGRTSLPYSAALREIDELVDHGRYFGHLEPYLDRFGPDQISVLDFALLQRSPEQFHEHLMRTLGLPDTGLPSHLHTPVRSAAAPRAKSLAKAGKLAAGTLRRVRAERLLGQLKSNRVIERGLFRPLAGDEKPIVSEADRMFIRNQLADDARALDATFGTSFSTMWWAAA